MNNNLPKYRRYIGVSQTKMANIADICLTTYMHKETGKKPFNQYEMAKIYGYIKDKLPDITIEELFFAN